MLFLLLFVLLLLLSERNSRGRRMIRNVSGLLQRTNDGIAKSGISRALMLTSRLLITVIIIIILIVTATKVEDAFIVIFGRFQRIVNVALEITTGKFTADGRSGGISREGMEVVISRTWFGDGRGRPGEDVRIS